jgi:hypothetical protein
MPFTIFFKEHIEGIEYSAWVPSLVTDRSSAVRHRLSEPHLFICIVDLSMNCDELCALSVNCGFLCALIDELRTLVWICDLYYYI